MAHNEYSINNNMALGVDWNASDSGTTYKIAPTIWRWDRYNTSNSGGSWDEKLTPDPSGPGQWTGLNFGSGSGWRQIDSFGTRTYTKTTSTQTVSLKISWYNMGTWWSGSGFVTQGSGNHTWTLTIPALPSYTISYNMNGGSGTISNQTKYQGISLTLSSTVPTKTGHAFSHWNTASDGSGASYESGGSYTANTAATLYAQYTPNTYAVTYDKNTTDSVSNVPDAQVKTYGVDLTLSSAVPIRAGHTFLGWATSASGSPTYQAGGTYTGNEAKTLYAVWRVDASITSLAAIRSNSSGNPDNEGSYGYIECLWSNPMNNSSISIAGTVTPQGGSATAFTFSSTTGTTSRTSTKILSGIDTNKNYTVTVNLSLSGTVVATKSVTLTKSAFVLDFDGTAGMGMGIGTAAPTVSSSAAIGELDVGWNATFDHDVSIAGDLLLYVNSSASSGTDYNLKTALTAAGWSSLLS